MQSSKHKSLCELLKQLQAIADRMKCLPIQVKPSKELLLKWAREIEAILNKIRRE